MLDSVTECSSGWWCVRFARVSGLHIKQVSRSLHLRFTAFTGDAMGMNMVSKVTVAVNLMINITNNSLTSFV